MERLGSRIAPGRTETIQRDPESIEGGSQRMLTLTLRGLERDGLVTRTVEPTIPPRVDYELTKLGYTLLNPILALGVWAQEHGAHIQAARQRYDSVAPGASKSR